MSGFFWLIDRNYLSDVYCTKIMFRQMQRTSQEHRTIERVIFMHQQIVRGGRRTDRGEGTERIAGKMSSGSQGGR